MKKDYMENKSTAEIPAPVSPYKGQRGGPRPGSGRPKGSENYDNKIRRALRSRWLNRINEIADKIFDAHQDIALGHFITVELPNGTQRVYKRAPNPTSLEWMMENIWGRAPQKIELEADIESNVTMTPAIASALSAAMQYAIPTKRTAVFPVQEPGTPDEKGDTRPSVQESTDGS